MLNFLQSLPSPIAQGMIWGIMAIGVYITYKILHGFHGALEVFQFFPRGSGGCRQTVGRFFVFCIDGGGGNGNPRRRRSDPGQGRGGHFSGCFRCVPQGVQVFACGFTRLFQ